MDALPTNQDELDALPVMENGKVLRISDDDFLAVTDRQGRTWSTGISDGVRYKQQAFLTLA